MWGVKNVPVCALQLIKCEAKYFVIVIDTISEGRGPISYIHLIESVVSDTLSLYVREQMDRWV